MTEAQKSPVDDHCVLVRRRRTSIFCFRSSACTRTAATELQDPGGRLAQDTEMALNRGRSLVGPQALPLMHIRANDNYNLGVFPRIVKFLPYKHLQNEKPHPETLQFTDYITDIQ